MDLYNQLLEAITENAADGVLTAFHDDDNLHLDSLEQDLRLVFDRHLRNATPIPSPVRIESATTLNDIPYVNLGAVDWDKEPAAIGE